MKKTPYWVKFLMWLFRPYSAADAFRPIYIVIWIAIMAILFALLVMKS